MSSKHPTPQAETEPFDPARMNAQTARLMASDMAALAGAMFRLLQPRATAETAPVAAPATPEPAAPAATLPVPGIAVPGLDLQPPTPDAPPVEPADGIAVPAIAVPSLAAPSLAVPGIQPPDEESADDADEADVASPRTQALMNEIAFLDD